MGRKASNSSTSLPLDDYRRKIGKHEWKKNKNEMREVKRQAEMKKNSHGIMDIVLMFGTFTAMVGAVYFMLYMYLHKEGTPVHVQDEP